MQTTMSITEALAEIKLILARIERKKEVILANLVRLEHQPDPYASVGGSAKMVKEESQAIGDLYTRLIRIREAIGKANLETMVTVEGVTHSIAGWLTWKREVAHYVESLWTPMRQNSQAAMKSAETRPQMFKAGEDVAPILVKVLCNVDIPEVSKNLETHSLICEKLDGQLSLKNAQVQVTF